MPKGYKGPNSGKAPADREDRDRDHRGGDDRNDDDDFEDLDVDDDYSYRRPVLTGPPQCSQRSITPEDEDILAEFFRHNPIYYDKTNPGYRIRARKMALLHTLAVDMRLTGKFTFIF